MLFFLNYYHIWHVSKTIKYELPRQNNCVTVTYMQLKVRIKYGCVWYKAMESDKSGLYEI